VFATPFVIKADGVKISVAVTGATAMKPSTQQRVPNAVVRVLDERAIYDYYWELMTAIDIISAQLYEYHRRRMRFKSLAWLGAWSGFK
jgi:hypothetical protein